MGRRTSYGRRNRRAVSRTRGHFFFICALAGVLLSIILLNEYFTSGKSQPAEKQQTESSKVTPSNHASTVDTVRIVAHGDLLYHLPILRGSEQFDGSYDFRRILPMSSPG